MTDIATAMHRSGEFRLHPLGFFYLQDRLSIDTIRRIHIWLSDELEHPELDRHQHSYDIRSRVVLGSLRSELFQFKQCSDRIVQEFAVTYEGGRSILSPTGRTGDLELFSAFESAAGTSYDLKAGVIHRVVVAERPCVTMLMTKERGIPIYSYGEQASETPFARRLANTGEANQIKELLRTSLV